MPTFDDHSPSLFVTLTFAVLLVAGVLIKFWLASRQIRHVAQNSDKVPPRFAPQVSLAAHQKAARYTMAKMRFGFLEITLGALLVMGWTLLGGLDALNQALLGVMGGGMLQQLALLMAFAAISALLELPITIYQTFVIENRFGFNKMTPHLWFVDLCKSTLVGALIALPVAAAMLWLMGTAGAGWWLWAWGLWMGINLLLMLVYPTLIAPLFNKFQPLEDESLKIRVTALMQRCGFSAKGLFVMDGSRRSAHANAYFTGFGNTKRVVFYDTLLRQLSPGEVEAVLAHELGHFKHKHIIQRIVGIFAMSLVGFGLLGWLSNQVWFYTGLGVRPNISLDLAVASAPNDALALVLFLLVTPVFTFLISPLFAQWSRQHEFQADAYAVEHANGTDLASALMRLYEDNASTLTPDPLFVKFYYSHPPATERLARMQTTIPT